MRGNDPKLFGQTLFMCSSVTPCSSLPFICCLTAWSLHMSPSKWADSCRTAVHHVGAVPPQEPVPNCRLRAAALFFSPKHPHFRCLLLIFCVIVKTISNFQTQVKSTGMLKWQHVSTLNIFGKLKSGRKVGRGAELEPEENRFCSSGFLRMSKTGQRPEEKMAACCCVA